MQPMKRATRRSPLREGSDASVEHRVVEAALELATGGGFEAVRQREVAERAGVALGTLYKRFKSKDELLMGVLAVETQKLASQLEREMPADESPLERAMHYFVLATSYFVRKPQLGRAVIRAVTSGDKVSERVMAYHAQQLTHVVAVLRPPAGHEPSKDDLTESEQITVAALLLQIWFAALVGWSGNLLDSATVIEQVRSAGAIILRGIR
jgi:AcrR family transcriptional regulator